MLAVSLPKAVTGHVFVHVLTEIPLGPNAPHNPIQTHGHQGKTEPGAAQAIVGYNYSLTSHV